jgi:hypothetical protein
LPTLSLLLLSTLFPTLLSAAEQKLSRIEGGEEEEDKGKESFGGSEAQNLF